MRWRGLSQDEKDEYLGQQGEWHRLDERASLGDEAQDLAVAECCWISALV